MCTNCGSDEIELCQCDDGKNSFTVSTASTVIADPMTIAVSNTGQYTGAWARPNQIVFIEGYGYYKCTASTATSITVAFPPSPFVAGGAYSVGSVDYDNSGTIPSGTKISPGGMKGDTGSTGNSSSLLDIANTSAETSTGSAVTSSTSFVDLSTKVVTGLFATNKDAIRIKAKYFINAAAIVTYGYPKITLTDNSGNTLNLTQLPTSMGGGDVYLTSPVANKGPNACEIDIIVTRASSTTADFQLGFSWKTLESYSAESTDYSLRPLHFMLEQTGATFNWGDTPITINFRGKVGVGADELKLGFYIIESLQKS